MHVLCYITDNDGDTLNLALVQYFFSEGEHKLLTEARKSTPKRALQFVSSQDRVHHYSGPLSKLHSGLHSFLETYLAVKVARDEYIQG